MSLRQRALLAVALATVMIGLLAGVAFAATQGTECTSDSSRVRLWENVQNDTQDGDDSYWKCFSDTDLSNDAHNLPGACKGWIGGNEVWNDCISSYTLWVPSGQKFCLYLNSGYSTLGASHTGPIVGQRWDVGAGWNDQLSSFKWISSTFSC